MKLMADKLKDLLVKPGHISADDFEFAVKEAEKSKRPIDEVIIDMELIDEDHLGRTIADGFHMRFIDLNKEKINTDVLHLIPELVARKKGVIAFARDEHGVKIGMTNPDDLEIKNFIEKRVGQNIIVYYITKKALQKAISLYKTGIRLAFDNELKKLKDMTLKREQRDEAAIKIVDMMILYGYESKASDIHVEPYRSKIVVRFRIDGVLHDVLEMPKELSEMITTRVKILSKMRTDEHRAAQDGKFQFKTEEETMDIRVSIVPVTGGEKVVMRLLSSKSRKFDLISLGLSKEDYKKVKSAIEKPHGMILVTGPTGSGKTTTVYAVLKILNTRDVNISTIEDPVEYEIEGISQIQVNTKTDLTFAKGLRAIVRQDPDIIMVGEIRDEETANIAVNSSMTGHLVLSTLHTNDSATTLPRLLDMGVEPFLVASTVNVAIAQRLVRQICEKCRVSYTMTDDERSVIENDPELKGIFENKKHKDLKKVLMYKGAGCKVCGTTGYSGRIGIFEVLEMESNIKDLIMKRATSDDLMINARQNGMTTMLEDGINKVLEGMTTFDEVIRASKM